jgi:hypothetical protein
MSRPIETLDRKTYKPALLRATDYQLTKFVLCSLELKRACELFLITWTGLSLHLILMV